MNRSSFVAKHNDKPLVSEPKDFVMAMKYYHQALNINNLVMDAFDRAEKMINEDITWKERSTESYFFFNIDSHNARLNIFATDMANMSMPNLALRIVEAINEAKVRPKP